MRKCIIMFIFFVFMLLLASLTNKTDVLISEDNTVALENTGNELMAANNETAGIKR